MSEQEKKDKTPPSFGVLTMPTIRDADYLETLAHWGSLPPVVSVPEMAVLTGKLCKQNPAALQKIIEDAIRQHEIRFWGMSHDGGWREGMMRVMLPLNGKPKIRPGSTSNTVTLTFDSSGPIHAEAMGIQPSDLIVLLQKRGRKVPDELSAICEHNAPEAPNGLTTPLTSTQRWTPDFVESVRQFRATHTAKETAMNFGVSEALIRRKLAGNASKPKKKKPATPWDALG